MKLIYEYCLSHCHNQKRNKLSFTMSLILPQGRQYDTHKLLDLLISRAHLGNARPSTYNAFQLQDSHKEPTPYVPRNQKGAVLLQNT